MNRRRSHRYGLRRGCGVRAPLAVQRHREPDDNRDVRTQQHHQLAPTRAAHTIPGTIGKSASDDHANSAPRLGGD
jgi:hypothetical protein